MICPGCRAENDDTAEACFTCGKAFVASANRITRGSVIASRYEILSHLGKGGMGMVYKAHDRILDETVALKTLRSDVAQEPELARRFRSETRLARKVRHENVCAIHEYGEDGGLRFIAMEYIDGVDLRRVLRDSGGLPPREAFEVSIEVARGLQAIHEAGVIHRDLKTTNIMRDAKGLIRLMDFGIAKQSGSDVTLGGQVVGTPEYMSPEQARGLRVDFRSDVYALGIVVYEIFTGRVPFHADTPIATILKQLNDPPPLEGAAVAQVPPPLLPILARALAKDPAGRFSSTRELVEALESARSQCALDPRFDQAVASPLDSLLDSSPTAVRLVTDSLAWPRRESDSHPPVSTSVPTGPTILTTSMGHGHTAVLPGEEPAAGVVRPSATSSIAAPASSPSRWHPWRVALVAAAGTAVVMATRWPSASRRPDPEPSASAAGVDAPPMSGSSMPGPTATPPPTTTASKPSDPRPSRVPPSKATRASGAVGAAPPPAPSGQDSTAETPPATMPSPPSEERPLVRTEATPLPLEPATPVRPNEADPIALPPSATPPAPHPGNRVPEYPRELLERGIAGQVFLKVLVSAAGEVKDVSVLSGEEPFARSATEAARSWRYSPALVDGQPRAVYVIIKVPFRPPKKR